MSAGRNRHHARLSAVAALGKTLTRRAGSVCELCGDGLDLRPFEITPAPEEPSDDAAILACSRCRDAIEGKKLPREDADFRFLETSIWSETPPAQVAAVRLLRRFADAGVDWAQQANEGLWLDEDTEARVAAG